MLVEIPYHQSANDESQYHGKHEVVVQLSGAQRLALHRVRAGMIELGDIPLRRGDVLAEIIAAVAEAAAAP